MNSDGFAQIIRDLPRVWQSLGRTRQIVTGGVAVALVAAIVAGITYFQQPQNVPLYTNLNEQDASAIVTKLKELKVPYTITDGGATIRVPQANSADLRLQLAGQGLPSGSGVGMVGMEVFDKTSFGITDFAQKLNFQRGLEGELTRTIRRLTPIEDARVHLVIPQDHLLASQQKDPTSSVMIKQKAGAKLSDDQVSSIKFLVSKGVEGLKPENVAVVDFNGNTLGKLDSPDQARNKEASSRVEMQRQREAELEKKIQGLLEQVLGPNHAVVRASVLLDWDQVAQKTETFSPGTTQPQQRSQKDVRENFNGTGADVPAALGVPGTQANIPTYQSQTGQQNSQYQRSDVTTNYEVSSDKREIVRAPGDIKSLGIAVMVDQAVKAAQVDQITQVVTAAAGIQPQRGDQLSVVSLPFDNSLAADLKKQQDEQQRMDYIQLGLRVLGVVLAFGGMFALFRYLVGTVRPKEQAAPPVAEPPSQLPGGTAALLPADLVQQQIQDAMRALLPPPAPVLDPVQFEADIRQKVHEELRTKPGTDVEEENRRNKIRDSIVQLAMQKPDALADVLGGWLDQGSSPVPSRSAGAA